MAAGWIRLGSFLCCILVRGWGRRFTTNYMLPSSAWTNCIAAMLSSSDCMMSPSGCLILTSVCTCFDFIISNWRRESLVAVLWVLWAPRLRYCINAWSISCTRNCGMCETRSRRRPARRCKRGAFGPSINGGLLSGTARRVLLVDLAGVYNQLAERDELSDRVRPCPGRSRGIKSRLPLHAFGDYTALLPGPI